MQFFFFMFLYDYYPCICGEVTGRGGNDQVRAAGGTGSPDSISAELKLKEWQVFLLYSDFN